MEISKDHLKAEAIENWCIKWNGNNEMKSLRLHNYKDANNEMLLFFLSGVTPFVC